MDCRESTQGHGGKSMKDPRISTEDGRCTQNWLEKETISARAWKHRVGLCCHFFLKANTQYWQNNSNFSDAKSMLHYHNELHKSHKNMHIPFPATWPSSHCSETRLRRPRLPGPVGTEVLRMHYTSSLALSSGCLNMLLTYSSVRVDISPPVPRHKHTTVISCTAINRTPFTQVFRKEKDLEIKETSLYFQPN